MIANVKIWQACVAMTLVATFVIFLAGGRSMDHMFDAKTLIVIASFIGYAVIEFVREKR